MCSDYDVCVGRVVYVWCDGVCMVCVVVCVYVVVCVWYMWWCVWWCVYVFVYGSREDTQKHHKINIEITFSGLICK